MAWDGNIIPDALLNTLLAAVAAAPNGSKNNAYMSALQSAIGTSWKRQLLRDDVVVFEGTGIGLIPYSGRNMTVPAVTKTSITSADIDTGEWIHRVINASDSTKYFAGLVTKTGGTNLGALSGDLVSPNNVSWSTFTAQGPAFDTSSQSWLDLLYNSMTLQGDLFSETVAPGGQSVAQNGDGVPFGGTYAKGNSTAGIRDSVYAGTGSYSFGNGINTLPAWGWMYPGFGHNDEAAEIEYRRMFCQVRRKSTKQWEFLYVGGRAQGQETYTTSIYTTATGVVGEQVLNYTPNSSKCRPWFDTGFEVWVEPSQTNPEIASFHGKYSNEILQDFDCVVVGFQCRIINQTPGKNAVFLANIGWDIFRAGVSPRYDANGYPYGAYDGGGGRWQLLPQDGSWKWITGVGVFEIARNKYNPPPWGNYDGTWIWGGPPNYGISWAEFQSNPPIDIIAYYPPDVPVTVYEIEAIGDSLTVGNDAVPNSYRTWRGNFQSLAANAGLTIDMIGPTTLPPATGGQDPDHAAYGGACIDSTGNANNNLKDRDSVIFATAYQPDIIVLYIGWNDLYSAAYNTANTRFETYYNNVRTQRPNAKVMLCSMHPQQGETEAQSNANVPGYANLNTKIRALAAANTTTTGVAELAQVSYITTDYFDVIHMNQTGASKHAQTIFDAIRAKGWM